MVAVVVNSSADVVSLMMSVAVTVYGCEDITMDNDTEVFCGDKTKFREFYRK